MGVISYLGSLIKNDTGNSSKSFALVMSTLLSFIVGIVICIVLAYDGFIDGVINTDLESAGIFMICVGSCVMASGVPKIFGDRAYSKANRYIGNGSGIGKKGNHSMVYGSSSDTDNNEGEDIIEDDV